MSLSMHDIQRRELIVSLREYQTSFGVAKLAADMIEEQAAALVAQAATIQALQTEVAGLKAEREATSDEQWTEPVRDMPPARCRFVAASINNDLSINETVSAAGAQVALRKIAIVGHRYQSRDDRIYIGGLPMPDAAAAQLRLRMAARVGARVYEDQE